MNIERIRELIHDLRNLPADWQWDYCLCDNCALGLLFRDQPDTLPCSLHASYVLGIPYQDADRIFIDGNEPDASCKVLKAVKPEDVAKWLEDYIGETVP